ncbi:MAG TPA: hypothetical protein VFM81_05475 [Actinomycetota bacterium]|nr:hypothetical protein [Actinomycetota bacterium]
MRMRRLLSPIAMVVFVTAVLASCSNDEPAQVIQPTSAFEPTGSTGQTAPTGPTSAGSDGPTGATAGLPTGSQGGGGRPGKLTTGQAAFSVTGDIKTSVALPNLESGAYAPPPGVLAIVWAAGGADASNIGLGGLSFTGTKPTSPTLTLTVTVQDKGTIATLISSAGECNVTIGQATANRVSGAFSCTNLSDGSNKVNLTGSFSAQG